MSKPYSKTGIFFCSILFYIFMPSILYSTEYSGNTSNPDLAIAWNVEKASEKRVKLTGAIKNVSISDKADFELTARAIDNEGSMSGEAKFRFGPVLFLSGKDAPFAMMIDVIDYENIAAIELNIYYGLTGKDQIYMPQFSTITFNLDVKSKIAK